MEGNKWRIEKCNKERDESGAATCGVMNKLCIIIGSKIKSLASHPGHNQSVVEDIITQ
jgi:hypothetical protein